MSQAAVTLGPGEAVIVTGPGEFPRNDGVELVIKKLDSTANSVIFNPISTHTV